MIKARLALTVIAAVCGVAFAGQAQNAPPPPPAPPGAEAAHHWDPATMRDRMEARRAHHLRALHDILEIRPDQEAAFQAFAEATKPQAKEPDEWRKDGERREPGQRAELTTPERLDMMTKRFDERTARVRDQLARHAAAVKSLYTALSPAQQKTMDALPDLNGPGGGREGGWNRHGGGMQRGPHGPGEGMGPPAAGE